ncbi:unnamed protein product, partial [Prorocentrum cordatum]
GTEYVMSLAAGTWKYESTKVAHCMGKRLRGLNELEMVEDFAGTGPKLLANLVNTRLVFAMDPETMECAGVFHLEDTEPIAANERGGYHVANGIAYNKKSGTFFVTGKNWESMYEIAVSKAPPRVVSHAGDLLESHLALAGEYKPLDTKSYLLQLARWQEIGVITPYGAQVREISRQLPPPVKNFIQVSTVDAFQGCEKQVILLSLVRANARGDVGFVADWRRLNVALTRSKVLCVLVGHLPTWLAADSGLLRDWLGFNPEAAANVLAFKAGRSVMGVGTIKAEIKRVRRTSKHNGLLEDYAEIPYMQLQRPPIGPKIIGIDGFAARIPAMAPAHIQEADAETENLHNINDDDSAKVSNLLIMSVSGRFITDTCEAIKQAVDQTGNIR